MNDFCVSKNELFQKAIHIVITLPFYIEKYHIIEMRESKPMKPKVTFINIGRGGLVGENAFALPVIPVILIVKSRPASSIHSVSFKYPTR